LKYRYLIAQALILLWWMLDLAILGTPVDAAPDSNGFVVSVAHSLIVLFAPFTLFVAAVVGVFDGVLDREHEIAATMLVGGLAALISFLGLGLRELLQPNNMPIDLRVALLVALELLMLIEWGIATLMRLIYRALVSRLGA